MHIFTDFKNDLAISIVIPRKNKRDAVKIFNEYDKTGTMLKKKSNNLFIDLVLESSITTGNPTFGIVAFIISVAILLLIVDNVLGLIFGNEVGNMILRLTIFGYLAFVVMSNIYVRIKRKRIMENE